MAVQNPDIPITPYTSTVPVVSIPPDVIQAQTTPAGPLQGEFGKKGTGALAIGDAILKGVMLGHQQKEQRKAQQAEATITAADKATEAAYSQYQDTLSQSGGNVNDPKAQAAYQAYQGVFNQAKQAKAAFVIPQKPQKGQKSGGQSGQSGQGKGKTPPGFGGIKDFFEANPHIIPQIALMTMQPKPPGQSRENKLQDMQMKAAQGEIDTQAEQLKGLKDENAQRQKDQQQKQLQQQVEANGGIEAVLADKKADPQLQQAARQMKYSQLDAQTPEGKLKMSMLGDIQSGANKNWNPQQRMLAGAMGLTPQPVEVTRTGKNGHQESILVDPLTNQPIPGSKSLDLGPPQWAQEFYAKQAADKSLIDKAVKSDPTAYGVQLTGDPKANKAAIEARAEQLQISAEFGIKSLADMFGRTGYEIQRDNTILTDVVKAAGLNAKAGASPLDTGTAMISYPTDVKGQDGKTIKAGQTFAVGRDYFNKILTEFTATPGDNSGVRGFRRATPDNPDKKPPQVLEAERMFLYGWVKNQMVDQKGKAALSPAEADAVLKNTALGQPIIAPQGMTPPPSKETATQPQRMTPPPNKAAMKAYIVPGIEGPVELTDEEADKARKANIPIEDASGVLQEFQRQ